MTERAESDDCWTDSEREAEVERVEAVMTVEEIFERGYCYGHSRAGLQSRHDRAFADWLDTRLESRGR